MAERSGGQAVAPACAEFESGDELDAFLRRLATRDAGGPWTWAIRALACVLPLLALRLLFEPFLAGAGGSTLFLPAVLIAGLWGSWRSGLIAAGLGLALSLAATLAGGSGPFDVDRQLLGGVIFSINAGFLTFVAQILRVSMRSMDAVRQAEQSRAAAIAESETRFRHVADSAPVLIWVTRQDRRRAFVNQAFVEFQGGDYQDVLDADLRDTLHPDDVDRVLAQSQAGEASGALFQLEARYRRHDGAWRWLRSYSHPRQDGAGGLLGFVCVAYDVTEAKQVEQDLIHINELLETRVSEALAEKEKAEAALMHAQKMEAVGRLTGGVAHDFNNLLTVVIGALDMVIRSPDDAGRRTRLLEAALSSARRGERLAHQLLAFSRRQSLKPQLCDLNAVISESEPLVRRAVGEAVQLNISLGRSLPVVSIDPAHFEAALFNLVVNARDATADGGEIEISTGSAELGSDEVEGATAGAYAVVRVRDTGAGMSPEVRERVFEPFFTTKPVGKGTGLGLSQVYGFMRQSGGAATIESAPGRGTTVSLFLPAMADAVPDDIEAAVEVSVEDQPYAGRTVLLVEDDAEVSAIARACLEQLGLAVTVTGDGPSALEAVASRSYDLLVTDLIMPGGMNGVDLARSVVEIRPDIAVLLSSGYAGEAVDRALANAPWPFLSKPYDVGAMRRAVLGAFVRREAAATD